MEKNNVKIDNTIRVISEVLKKYENNPKVIEANDRLRELKQKRENKGGINGRE